MKGFYWLIPFVILLFTYCRNTEKTVWDLRHSAADDHKVDTLVSLENIHSLADLRDVFCLINDNHQAPYMEITERQSALLPDSVAILKINPTFHCPSMIIDFKSSDILNISYRKGSFIMNDQKLKPYELEHILATFYFYTALFRGKSLETRNHGIVWRYNNDQVPIESLIEGWVRLSIIYKRLENQYGERMPTLQIMMAPSIPEPSPFQ